VRTQLLTEDISSTAVKQPVSPGSLLRIARRRLVPGIYSRASMMAAMVADAATRRE
jgi:hypothetical protein